MTNFLSKKLMASTVAFGAFVFTSSSAYAWTLYSWDLRYKKECHFHFNHLEESSSIVCGDWGPAKTNPGAGGAIDTKVRPPAPFPHSVTIDTVPEIYRAQIRKAAKVEGVSLEGAPQTRIKN